MCIIYSLPRCLAASLPEPHSPKAVILYRMLSILQEFNRCTNRSRKCSVDAPRRLLCADSSARHQKSGPAQTDLEVKYCYNVDEKSHYISRPRLGHALSRAGRPGRGAEGGTTFSLTFRHRKTRLEALLNCFAIGWTLFPMPSTPQTR